MARNKYLKAIKDAAQNKVPSFGADEDFLQDDGMFYVQEGRRNFELVAHYTGRVPRKALEFARYMKLIRQMKPGVSWEDVAREVAQDEGIDEFGMSGVHLKILKALKDGAIAKNRMVNVTGRKLEEVERYIMPILLTSTDDQPAMVEVLSRGYSLTEAGFAELVKRGEKIEKVSESESEQ